jgi:hypothetical protein
VPPLVGPIIAGGLDGISLGMSLRKSLCSKLGDEVPVSGEAAIGKDIETYNRNRSALRGIICTEGKLTWEIGSSHDVSRNNELLTIFCLRLVTFDGLAQGTYGKVAECENDALSKVLTRRPENQARAPQTG